ncbi:MAG: hypothetical protein A2283_06135 [Lentisphaerae bacterium RIFOXYA12_FULL_48_11]|nr:MAG: hypothetical protein A2283_06135 [Lentisphaerae bacterium RIFOXYA12_FULL_48_11]
MTELARSPKLSKSFFFGLTEGVYLISNVGDKFKPSFAEPISSADKREEQWNRIKQARVDQQLCHVFVHKKDFDKAIKEWGPCDDKQG